MVDQRTGELPEGTDTVIEGAANTGSIATSPAGRDRDSGSVTISGADGRSSGSSSENGLGDRLRSGGERLAGQAGEKARGLVGQGLERTSEALANVSKMVGDTAPGIEERLGPDYADYARRAAGAIENVANSIAGKDPDELIDDTRNFVRNSPGIALAGATVVGFVLTRLLKGGIAANANDNGSGSDDRD